MSKASEGFLQEIPWEDDSRWTEIAFDWMRTDQDTGQKPEGTEYLFHVEDGAEFEDGAGRRFVKQSDGPVQGACVVTDSEGFFAQLGGESIVRPI